jgi:hypothetical protein
VCVCVRAVRLGCPLEPAADRSTGRHEKARESGPLKGLIYTDGQLLSGSHEAVNLSRAGHLRQSIINHVVGSSRTQGAKTICSRLVGGRPPICSACAQLDTDWLSPLGRACRRQLAALLGQITIAAVVPRQAGPAGRGSHQSRVRVQHVQMNGSRNEPSRRLVWAQSRRARDDI